MNKERRSALKFFAKGFVAGIGVVVLERQIPRIMKNYPDTAREWGIDIADNEDLGWPVENGNGDPIIFDAGKGFAVWHLRENIYKMTDTREGSENFSVEEIKNQFLKAGLFLKQEAGCNILDVGLNEHEMTFSVDDPECLNEYARQLRENQENQQAQ